MHMWEHLSSTLRKFQLYRTVLSAVVQTPCYILDRSPNQNLFALQLKVWTLLPISSYFPHPSPWQSSFYWLSLFKHSLFIVFGCVCCGTWAWLLHGMWDSSSSGGLNLHILHWKADSGPSEKSLYSLPLNLTFFQVPLLVIPLQYLSFCVQFTSLSIIPSKSVHVVASSRISFFF